MADWVLAGGMAVALLIAGWVANRRWRPADRRPTVPDDIGPFPAVLLFTSDACDTCPPARDAVAAATAGAFREYVWEEFPGVFTRLRIDKVPTTWVVDAEGRVARVIEGKVDESTVRTARRGT